MRKTRKKNHEPQIMRLQRIVGVCGEIKKHSRLSNLLQNKIKMSLSLTLTIALAMLHD